MPKEIIFAPNAEREIKKLSRDSQKHIVAAMEEWRDEIRVFEIEKLKTQPDFYRLRVGNFRLIYYPLSKERVVLLLVRDRKKAYKELGNLNAKLDTALKRLNLSLGG